MLESVKIERLNYFVSATNLNSDELIILPLNSKYVELFLYESRIFAFGLGQTKLATLISFPRLDLSLS